MKFKIVLSAACLCAAAQLAHAELVVVDGKVSVAPTTVQTPAPGSDMKSVEQRFGPPRTRHPTVGNPPITRWDYQGFAVFFEGSKVISSVATGN